MNLQAAPHSRRFAAAVATLTATLALASFAARAGDCWVASARPPASGHATLERVLDAAEAAQRADTAINAIPDVRYRIHRHVDAPAYQGAPRAAVSYVMLHQPGSWAGSCGLVKWADNVHFASLSVHLNDLRAVRTSDASSGLPGLDAFFEPEATARSAGATIYEDRVLVITHAGVAPFVPVSVGEYLDAWARRITDEQAQMRGEAAPHEDPQWKRHLAELRRTDPQAAAELERAMHEAGTCLQQAEEFSSSELADLDRLRAS